jgi:hypothetical protein
MPAKLREFGFRFLGLVVSCYARKFLTGQIFFFKKVKQIKKASHPRPFVTGKISPPHACSKLQTLNSKLLSLLCAALN